MRGFKTPLCTFVLLMLFSSIYADNTIYIDNNEVQSYKGRFGKWLYIDSSYKLNSYLNQFKSTMVELDVINNRVKGFGRYYFVPYSEEYLTQNPDILMSRKNIDVSDDKFIWPLFEAKEITSAFGMRSGELHAGIDLPAQIGTPIVAAMEGRIKTIGYSGGHGNTIYIEHRNYFFTRYSHASVIFIEAGDYVRRGQVIGLVGSTGNSTGNHLHFELHYNDIPLNPIDFLPEKHLETRVPVITRK